MRILIRHVVSSKSDAHLVGEAEDGPEAVEMVKITRPDLIVMASNLNGMDSVQTTRTILNSFPDILIIVISDFLQSEEINKTLNVLDAGAVDIIATASAHLQLDIASVKTDLMDRVSSWGGCSGKELELKKEKHRTVLTNIRQSLV